MIRLGLIGCGEHSESGHAIPLARYKAAHSAEIELTAACDLDLERAQFVCRQYGFTSAYRDVDECWRGKNWMAASRWFRWREFLNLGSSCWARDSVRGRETSRRLALQKGRHCSDAARATRIMSMVSVNRRFMPFLNRALEWARTAGSLRYVRCTMTRYERREPEFLWATAVHAVDALRHIAGEVVDAKDPRAWTCWSVRGMVCA